MNLVSKAFLPLLVFLFSVLSGILLPFSSANAQSTYDSLIQTTNDFKISNPNNDCGTVDLFSLYTLPFSNIVNDGAPHSIPNNDSLKIQWADSSSTKDAVKSDFDNKQRWLTYTKTYSNGKIDGFFAFTSDPNASMGFWSANGYNFFGINQSSQHHISILSYSIQLYEGHCTLTVNTSTGHSTTPQTDISSTYLTSIGQSVKFWYVNVPIVYPSDYGGINPPDTAPVAISENSKLRPNITIDVMDKNVSINSKIDDTVKAQYPDYKIYWFITNATFDGSGVPEGCGNTSFSTSGYSIPSEPLNFEAPCYAKYSVSAYFSYNNGDYPLDDFGEWHIVETTISVDINGGFFSIDTDNDFICDENNSCVHESALWEDQQCDLLHLGGCVNNIFHYISVALGIDKTATNPTGSPFISFRTDTHGLLSIITAPLVAINALTTSSCTPVSFTITQISKTITLPCYYSIYQSNLGAVFTLYQTLATGVISYYVIVGVLRQVKDIKDPKKDQIEVAQL